MYEYFDFDYEHAVFEWDEEKAAYNFTKYRSYYFRPARNRT